MAHAFSTALSEEVRAETGRQQISDRQLATKVQEVVDVSLSTLNRSVRGVRDWESDVLYAVAEVLGVPLPELIRRAQDTMQRKAAAAETRCTQPLVSLGSSSLVSASSLAVA